MKMKTYRLRRSLSAAFEFSPPVGTIAQVQEKRRPGKDGGLEYYIHTLPSREYISSHELCLNKLTLDKFFEEVSEP